MKNNIFGNIKTLIIGLFFGVCSLVPGLSLGTLAVSFNLFDRFITIGNNPKEEFKKEWLFLLLFLGGLVIGLFSFAQVINYLMEKYSIIMNFFFLGVVIGSIPLIWNKTVKPKFKPLTIIPFLICLAIMVGTVVFVPSAQNTINVAITPTNMIKMVVFGAIASACMIMPGISGTFVLMFIGAYASVIAIAAEFNIILMLCFGVGILIGVVGCAKGIDALLRRWPNYTYGAIFGFVLGSLLAIYPKGYSFSQHGILPILLFFVGAAITILINMDFSKFKNKKAENSI